MKRKLIYYSFLLIGLVSVFSYSCQREENSDVAVLVQKNKIEFGELTPAKIEIDANIATVTFIQSARLFVVDTKVAGGEHCLALLNKAQEEDVPVKISLFENTNEIAQVSEASKYRVQAYRNEREISCGDELLKSRVRLPVIPSEKALNTLFESLKLPSIPFSYAADGCYARAHKMRQIILEKGYDCAKLFAYGKLAASNGTCCVRWGYHVAPLVIFRTAAGKTESRVLDPSLFPNSPVTQKKWLNACQNRSCNSYSRLSSTKITHGYVYVRSESGRVVLDDNYRKTECTLLGYSGLSGCKPYPLPDCW